MGLNIKGDISDYFFYLEENINNNTRITEKQKSEILRNISLFKVLPLVSHVEHDEIDTEAEIYYLFEYISRFVFNILNYRAWRKRVLFGVI